MLSFSKKLFCVLLFSFIVREEKGFCQNLVPNPSFEDTLDCGPGSNPPSQVPPWFNPTLATPDYYSIYPICGASSISNPGGFQMPYSGNAYMGLYTYLLPSSREYIEVKLSDSLIANNVYNVSFYVSRADKFAIATDGMGAYLSNDSIMQSNGSNFPYVPQIRNPAGNILFDSMNWIPISGIYHALGGEKFITIGNFFDNNNTVIDTIAGGLYFSGYYYIDQVIVVHDSASSISDLENVENQINVYPNPASNNINLYSIDINAILVAELFETTGKLLLRQNFRRHEINKTIVLTEIKNGIYILKIFLLKNKYQYFKITIIH